MVPERTTVARVDEVPEGEMIGATVDGVEVLVVNVHGAYRAIGSECTHAGCMLHEDGELDEEKGVVTCLCHGSGVRPAGRRSRRAAGARGRAVYRLRVGGGEIQAATAKD